MNICYIPTFHLPWCATSWRRALELGKAVSKYHDVTFMCPEAAVTKLKTLTVDADVQIVPVKITINGYIGRGLSRVLALKAFDIVHTFKPMPDIFPSGFAAKHKGALWVADLDDLEGGQGYNRNSPLWKRKLMDFFEWLVPACADGVTVASHNLKHFYAKHDPFYIPNGADPEIFRPLKQTNRKPVVLFMGLFHPEIVDADMVIRAVAKVSARHHVRILMVGDGDERPKAERLANNLNLDATFTGHIDDVPAVIASADIGVISFRDNLLNRCKCPLRLYEFMACGLPVVATNVGEPAHVLKDGLGLLVEPDVESISKGLLSLLENPSLAQKYSQESRKAILKTYNWEVLGNMLVRFYEKLKGYQKQK